MPWGRKEIHGLEKWWNKKKKGLSQPYIDIKIDEEKKRVKTIRVHQSSRRRADQEIVALRLIACPMSESANYKEARVRFIAESFRVIYDEKRLRS